MTKKLSLFERVNALLLGYSKNSEIKRKISGLTPISTLRGYLSKKKKYDEQEEKLLFRLRAIRFKRKELENDLRASVSRDRQIIRNYLPDDSALKKTFLGE